MTGVVRQAAATRRGSREDNNAGVIAILMTDVEPAVRLNAALEAEGFTTFTISPMDDVRGDIRRAKPDILVLTGALLDANNISLVRHLLWDGVPVIGFTDVSDPSTTERLREIGYAELAAKPVDTQDVVDTVRRRMDRKRLTRVTGLIGESAPIHEVLVKIEQIAPVSSTVLIEGESGTGKELVARAIHKLSPRRARPFIAVNVGALPETLLESELFGHEKGSFTGAAERRLGRFELADSGTLFLDEIGEIPQSTQVKLLRVLEEREITRVGGTATIPVDVRVVAATNRPLREHVESGQFRADLFYRLNVLSMYLPPLRERREDIALLVRRYVTEFSQQHDREFHGISGEAMHLLEEYAWPGNVRELRNLIESMVVLAPGREIIADDIPRSIKEQGSARLLPVPFGMASRDGDRSSGAGIPGGGVGSGGGVGGGGGREFEFIIRSLVDLKLQVEELRRRLDSEGADDVAGQWVGEVRDAHVLPNVGFRAQEVHHRSPVRGIEPRDTSSPPEVIAIGPGITMAEIERRAIEAALRETDGNRRKAADMLGIGERTLYRKLREYDVESIGYSGEQADEDGDSD